jgi:cell division protein FtsN
MTYLTFSNSLDTTKLIYFLLSANIVISFIGCSSSQETTKEVKETKEEEVYVFDEIPPEDAFKFESPVQQSVDIYVVQIGAFSSLERAKDFAEHSRAILNKDIKVEFNEKKYLYVVWIHPPYQEKAAAEDFRNELWNHEEFKDAWIVTVDSKK